MGCGRGRGCPGWVSRGAEGKVDVWVFAGSVFGCVGGWLVVWEGLAGEETPVVGF